MGVACQAPVRAAARRVKELKAQSKEEGQHKLDAYLASAAQRKVSGFMVEINGEEACNFYFPKTPNRLCFCRSLTPCFDPWRAPS